MEKEQQLRRTLTLVPLLVIGLAYMDPLVVFDSYGIVAQLTKGHVAAAYLFTIVALLLTAYSYGKMVQAYPKAGSAYTYAYHSLHPHVGFVAGWTLLLDYLFLPMVNFAIGMAYLSAAFPDVSPFVWVLILAISITTINAFGIQLTANITSLLVTFQIIVACVFAYFMVVGLQNGLGTGELLSPLPFFSPSFEFTTVFTGASILCFSFLGFDAVSTLSEETKNPEKTVPRAIMLVVLVGGVLFVSISYLMQQVYPHFQQFQSADSASLEIALYAGGAFLHAFFLAGTMVAVVSSSLSSHASAARILFAMGRDNALPKRFFGYVHPRLKTPLFNVLLIGVISLTAAFGELEIIYSFISFGALIGFTSVNASVIGHYFIRERKRSLLDMIRFLFIPSLGASFCLWLLASIDQHALFIGSTWLTLGLIYYIFRRRHNPDFSFHIRDKE
ncbi:APC family permease [Shouchella lonarensis]|uniref:Putrescine:proton symporter, AAT family n=1 Tax=Shouchella lonarensis TaxID=1464122 RepID=A0A1G6MZ50_9BACI|nr:putrescine:proton symporter, AAT family [Shouchella lonarensis]